MGLYQSLSDPESAATEATLNSKLISREGMIPPGGTNGVTDGITRKGEFQEDRRSALGSLFGMELPLTRHDRALVFYTGWLALLCAALVVAAGMTEPLRHSAPMWPLAALAAAALLAELQSVRLTSRAAVSVSSLPIVLAAVIYGPLGAIAVSFASLLCDLRAPYARWVTWTSSRCIGAGCSGAVALSIGGLGAHGFSRLFVAVAAATVVGQVVDLFLGSVAARLRGMSVHEIAKLSSTVFVAMLLYIPVAALLVYAYREVSPWSVVLFLFPAFAAHRFFALYQDQRVTAEELATAMERQEKANLSFASALVATLDARDRYTAGHSAAVAVYARDIARRLGLSEQEQELVRLCGLVHDIGKVGLPAGLLEKPGPLTLDERRQMERHSMIGERILQNVEGYDEIAHVVRHHHERFDGQGYPDGLRGEQIPLLARVIAVADAYDAMTSDRPYRDSMPSHVARLRMAQAVGTQFDTTVVAAFEAILAQKSEDYRLGIGAEFAFGIHSIPLNRPAWPLEAAEIAEVEAQAS